MLLLGGGGRGGRGEKGRGGGGGGLEASCQFLRVSTPIYHGSDWSSMMYWMLFTTAVNK